MHVAAQRAHLTAVRAVFIARGAGIVAPFVTGVAGVVTVVAALVVTGVIPRIVARNARRRFVDLGPRARDHAVMDLHGLVERHVDPHPVRPEAVELEHDLVAAGGDVQALEEAVEVVHDAGVVAVHVHARLVRLDHQPQRARAVAVARAAVAVGVRRVAVVAAVVIGRVAVVEAAVEAVIRVVPVAVGAVVVR